MKNCFEEILDVVKKSKSIFNEYNDEEKAVLNLNEIQESISRNRVQVLLYGAYNAGKSTLVNTLLGAQKARINDIPTTDTIDRYDFEGIDILDSPGINAPIEHQVATEEQIKRSNLILFVIRQGDQDVKDVYDRMFDMIKRGKKIFLILNCEPSSLKDKEELKSKVNQILLNYGKKNNITESDILKINFFTINLKLALKGRIEGAGKLIENSGYFDFIDSFHLWINELNNEGEYLNGIKRMINEIWFEPILEKIQHNMVNLNDNDYKLLVTERNTYISEKSNSSTRMFNFIKQQVLCLKSDISSIIENNSDNQHVIESQLQNLFFNLTPKIEQEINDIIDNLSAKLSIPFALERELNLNSSEEKSNPIVDILTEQLKQKIADKDTINQALLLGRKFKIPLLKGRWEKTLGRWSGRAAIVAQVAVALYDAYSANKQEKLQNETERKKAIELYQIVDEISQTVISSLFNDVKIVLDAFYNAKIDAITAVIEEKKMATDKIQSDYETFINYRNKIDMIGV